MVINTHLIITSIYTKYKNSLQNNKDYAHLIIRNIPQKKEKNRPRSRANLSHPDDDNVDLNDNDDDVDLYDNDYNVALNG